MKQQTKEKEESSTEITTEQQQEEPLDIRVRRKSKEESSLLVARQGSTITIKSPYVITYVRQNFGVRDVRGQIPKSLCQASYLLPSDFPNNFPKLVLI